MLLAHARTVAGEIDRLKAHAKHLAGGLEPELSIAVDVMFPMTTLTAAVTAFHAAFPLTPLRLFAETLGAVMQSVLDGHCTIGASGELGWYADPHPGTPAQGAVDSRHLPATSPCEVRTSYPLE